MRTRCGICCWMSFLWKPSACGRCSCMAGGKAINRAMDEAGITPSLHSRPPLYGRGYAGDRRTRAGVRDEPSIWPNGSRNSVVERPRSISAPRTSCGASDCIWRTNKGERIDLGHVGVVSRVDRDTINNLCFTGVVPVIPSMCRSEKGEKLNVNADTAAHAVARVAWRRESRVPQRCEWSPPPQGTIPDSLVNSLTATQAREMIRSGAIDKGMIPQGGSLFGNSRQGHPPSAHNRRTRTTFAAC